MNKYLFFEKLQKASGTIIRLEIFFLILGMWDYNVDWRW